MGNTCSYYYYHYCCCDECCECSPEDCFEDNYKGGGGYNEDKSKKNSHLKEGNITYRFLSYDVKDPYYHT